VNKKFQDVLENPRSLRARHALASHLIGLGDPLGTFIDGCLRYHERERSISLGELDEQYFALLRKHEAEWKAPVLQLVFACDLRLGLVSAVSVGGESLVAHGAELMAKAPIIAFSIKSPYELRRNLDSGVLRNTVELRIPATTALDDSLAIALANSPDIRQLRTLDLEGGSITQRGLYALANSKNLPDLISIEVTGNPCAQSGGVMRNDDRDYFVCAAGESFLATAQHDMLLSSDPMVLHWPPLFDQYAWLP
jgi:hypothetical protein